jgi:hypothetical protein
MPFLVLAFDCFGLFAAGDMTNSDAEQVRIAVGEEPKPP